MELIPACALFQSAELSKFTRVLANAKQDVYQGESTMHYLL